MAAEVDQVYADAVRTVLAQGARKRDRTGTSTVSYTGLQLRVDLRRGFPLLTRKAVPFRAVARELQWFLQGRTDVGWLQARGVHIWDDDAAKAAARGFGHYAPGELGPVYGAQWRTWGGRGVDQVARLREALAADPSSRRLLVSAWNAEDLGRMVLPPCHHAWQVLVSDDGLLDLVVSQRSGDLGLGVPFNLASYGLLMALLAREFGLTARTLVLNVADAHVYADHVAPLRDDFLLRPVGAPCTLALPAHVRSVGDFAAWDDDDGLRACVRGYAHAGRLPLPLST